jgi:zinc D-Ala-D-Ala carboxypeptidase
MKLNFMVKVEALRNLWGKPLKVNSGSRCKGHNSDVGGEPASRHMFGEAADIRTANREESLELAKTAEAVGFGGIGVYPTWVHVDIGPSRRWVR